MHTHETAHNDAIPMAGLRNVNVNILNKELRDLANEAQSIETQMEVLLARLNNLRDGIAGYNTTQIEVLSNDIAKAEPAKNAPQAILPVKERPKPIVKKAAVKPKPAQSVPPKTETKQKASTTSGNGVKNVRVGVHKDKTRMVFDVNGSTKHTMNFDQEAGVVTMTFPETKWSATKSKTYTLDQISGFEAKETEQGTIIAIAVRNASDVKAMTLSNPNRLVLDVLK